MKIGVFTVLLSQQPLEQVLDYLAGLGVEAVELGAGNYAASKHCDTDLLLADAGKRQELLRAVESRGMVISALSTHGNPLHPDPAVSKPTLETQRKAIRLAAELGVGVVAGFSGCPGDQEGAKYPNWVTCPWPTDYSELLEWQWSQVAIPVWKEEAAFARKHRIKIALEMHPGFVVYNPETLLRLREACGEEIGANFDPSHLFWQGIDPSAAVRALEGAIFHCHAKDTSVCPYNSRVNGVLDTKSYLEESKRSWIFRTVGFGNAYPVWKAMISNLRMTGYDGVLSIEHEDSLMSPREGLEKAVSFLKQVIIRETPGQAWWT